MTTKLDETLTIDQPQKEFMEQLVMPVIALRGLVVFPGMSVQFDVHFGSKPSNGHQSNCFFGGPKRFGNQRPKAGAFA